MNRPVPGEVGDAAPGRSCEFETDGQRCGRLATTQIEWDIDGSRERRVFCDEHAALLLTDPTMGLSIADQVSLMHEALTEPFGEAARVAEQLLGPPLGDTLLAEYLEHERRRFGLDGQEPGVQRVDAATSNDVRNLLDAARIALERNATALRAEAGPDGDTRPAGQMVAYTAALVRLDPAGPLDQHQLDALRAGQHSLQLEAADWRHMADLANDRWRPGFERHASDMERLADGIRTLREQLADRDLGAEWEAER